MKRCPLLALDSPIPTPGGAPVASARLRQVCVGRDGEAVGVAAANAPTKTPPVPAPCCVKPLASASLSNCGAVPPVARWAARQTASPPQPYSLTRIDGSSRPGQVDRHLLRFVRG